MREPKSRSATPDGEKIKSLIEARGFHVGELARQAKLGKRTLERIIAGGKADVSNIRRLAEAMEVEYAEIVKRSDNSHMLAESLSAESITSEKIVIKFMIELHLPKGVRVEQSPQLLSLRRFFHDSMPNGTQVEVSPVKSGAEVEMTIDRRLRPQGHQLIKNCDKSIVIDIEYAQEERVSLSGTSIEIWRIIEHIKDSLPVFMPRNSDDNESEWLLSVQINHGHSLIRVYNRLGRSRFLKSKKFSEQLYNMGVSDIRIGPGRNYRDLILAMTPVPITADWDDADEETRQKILAKYSRVYMTSKTQCTYYEFQKFLEYLV